MQTTVSAQPFLTPPPRAALTNTFARAFDNSVAAARTCYAPRVISTEEVAKDERARDTRDRIARETYVAGHHTTLQHAHFQFAISNVSRQFLWSFLHSHPFYNSEQVSQRYVEVKPNTTAIPRLEGPAQEIYEKAVLDQHAAYKRLIELLIPAAAREYYRI